MNINDLNLDIKRISLKPADILWVKTTYPNTMPKHKIVEYCHELKNVFSDAFPKNKIILTDKNVEIFVLNGDEDDGK